MKCPKCGWEGEESELVEEPSELRPNDKFGSAIFIMAAKRSTFVCPSCRTPLLEKKFMYGGEVESKDLKD
ncbi:MAG TPA: hypothetical protein VGK23_01310 [Methanomassiliicoccales archaeon]|jgi:hypothetical protein